MSNQDRLILSLFLFVVIHPLLKVTNYCCVFLTADFSIREKTDAEVRVGLCVASNLPPHYQLSATAPCMA